MNWSHMAGGSLRNLRRFKARSFFMSIGVALGVATLIAGNSVSGGAEQKITEQINQMFGPGTILVASYDLKLEHLSEVAERMEQVVDFAPQMMIGEREISTSGASAQAGVAGYSENADYVWNRGVVDGRFFDGRDIERTARVALIGTSLKQVLFGDGDAIGEDIQIGSSPFEVIGILEPIGIDPHGDDRDMDVYIPITTMMRRVANTDTIGMGKFVVSNADLVVDDADEMGLILRELFEVADGEPDSFRIYTSKFAGKAAIQAKRALGTYVLLAGLVVLLVAAAVISAIMLVVVRERVAEIGLRKALGATPRLISLQFLFESTTITLVAGVVGIGLGIAVAEVIGMRFAMPVDLKPLSILGAVSASIVVGIVSGIIPARRAASLDPVEALR